MYLGLNVHCNQKDAEYNRILQELMKLGIAPSGNKSIDKGKLEVAKTELIQKIQNKEKEDAKFELKIEPIEGTIDTQRAEMEKERLGAMTVSDLNRLYFHI